MKGCVEMLIILTASLTHLVCSTSFTAIRALVVITNVPTSIVVTPSALAITEVR